MMCDGVSVELSAKLCARVLATQLDDSQLASVWPGPPSNGHITRQYDNTFCFAQDDTQPESTKLASI